MKVLLADALLRRKELMHKVAQLHQIKEKDCFEDIVHRQPVSDGVDEVKARVSKVRMKDLTKEYDFYSGTLRRLDGRIQNANWTTEIDVADDAMKAFEEDQDREQPDR